jgi:arsenate reductase
MFVFVEWRKESRTVLTVWNIPVRSWKRPGLNPLKQRRGWIRSKRPCEFRVLRFSITTRNPLSATLAYESDGMAERMLFVCTHNSARSQMAEGFVNALYSKKYKAYSAGTEPSTINPFAIAVMAEAGVDISSHHSKSVTEFLRDSFDYVVTVCDQAKETCPFFPGGKTVLHRGFEDPSDFRGTDREITAEFRKIRDEIRAWIIETFGPPESF